MEKFIINFMEASVLKNSNRLKRCFIDLGVLVFIFLFTIFSFLILKQHFLTQEKAVYGHVYSYLLLFLIILAGVILKVLNKLNVKTALFLIFLAGVSLKINYILMTPYNYRQHDVITKANDGHQGYAWTLFTTWKLPTLTTKEGYLAYQFYHPPFNAFMQAGWMKIFKGIYSLYNSLIGETIYNVEDPNVLFESVQILSTMYMVITCYICTKLIYKMKIGPKGLIIGAVLFNLFTTFSIQSAQENNDPLCILFCFAALYYTYNWYYDQSNKSAVGIGICVGLAAAAKFSGFVAGIPAFVIYIINLIKGWKGDKKKFIIQPLIIALIAAPLGLWFQIYAKIRFNQPFNYVFGNLTSKLYKGDYSTFERFICFWDVKDMTSSLYPSTFIHYNLFNFIVKSAMLGEWSVAGVSGIMVVAIAANYFFILLSIILFIIYFVLSKSKNLKEKVFAGLIIVSNAICMIYFNISMPYGCTMDFRYIVPILVGFGTLLALSMDELLDSKNKVVKIFTYIVLVFGATMIVSSNLVYLMGY